MALLAEEIAEEWLNRNGYFTIRGAKVGVNEIDLLAIKPTQDGLVCRQIEVQASVNPVSYITAVPKQLQNESGRKPGSAKLRSREELHQGVQEWIDKKFGHKKKSKLRSTLAQGEWSRELVVNKVKHQHELDILKQAGIRIHDLSEILKELNHGKTIIEKAAGANLVELASISLALK